MKAGIYFNPKNDRLYYINRERRILCYSDAEAEVNRMSRADSIEFRVRTRKAGRHALLEDDTQLDRIHDVPYGCPDPVQYLYEIIDEITIGGLSAIAGFDYANYVIGVQCNQPVVSENQ